MARKRDSLSRKIVYSVGMDTIFDDLEAYITAPSYDWRPVAVKLLGNLATGLAIGLGVAVGMALAG